MHAEFQRGIPSERDHLEVLRMSEENDIKTKLRVIYLEGVNSINEPQDRGKWRDLVIKVT